MDQGRAHQFEHRNPYHTQGRIETEVARRRQSEYREDAEAAYILASRGQMASQLRQKSTFQFPAGLGQGKDDLLNWMLITAYEIVGGWEGTKAVKFGDPSGAVALPIPPGIQATYEQNWNQATVGLGAMAVAQAAQTDAGQWGTGKIQGWMSQMGLGGGAGTSSQTYAASDGSTEFIGAALKKFPGVAESLQTTLGVRALDQVMMSYAGPAFRNFTYTYSLKPNNPEDSEQIDEIVKWFKFKSAPKQGGTRFTRLYKLPHVFKIQFFTASDENRSIPRVGHCALTNINTQYGGDIFRTFEGTHAPVQVNLTLAFKEMELLNQESFVGHDY